MLTARTIRRHARTSRLLLLLALFALGGTACADLEGVLPGDDLPGAIEEASEEPSDADDEAAGGDAADEGEAPADEAADDDAAAEADAPAEDAGGDEVEPITAEQVERICADDAASATTAEELAPLIGTTPAAFEELVCTSVAS